MITFRSLLLFFTLLLLTTSLTFGHSAHALEIDTKVDRNPVTINESFQIIFSAHDSPDQDPDFSPLEQDFTILNQNHSTSMTWINGKSIKLLEWRVQVMAKNTGNVVVPSIAFGSDKSSGISLLVTAGIQNNYRPQQNNHAEDMFLDVSLSASTTYIQAQIIYTLRLFSRIDIAQARLNEPTLAEAVVEKLGDDSIFNTQVDGETYMVTERKYAIFPQKSGHFIIKPIDLTAEIISQTQRPMFNGFFNSQLGKSQHIQSKALELEVKPVPELFKNQAWLPSEQLTLTESWSADTQSLTVGEPLTRTLKITAQGTTVGLLPELTNTSNVSEIKTYPDQPVLKEDKNADGVHAVREEKLAYMFSKPGDYTLPAIKIAWFNTKTQHMAEAILPEVHLTALASAVSSTTQAPPEQAVETRATSSDTPNKLVTNTANLTVTTAAYWPWVALGLTIAWLATLIFFLSKPKPSVSKATLKTVDPKTVELKAIKQQLKQACDKNDMTEAKKVLLNWATLAFNLTSLGALAEHCEARLRDEILVINALAYGPETANNTALWSGKRLYQSFIEHEARIKLTPEKKSTNDGLTPLFRL
jgi:hypothetical protein